MPQIDDTVFVADSADVIGKVVVDELSSIWYNTVVRGDIENITIGAGTNIQDLCVLHTSIGAPLVVGDGVTVGHHVTLHGCTIKNHSLIGMGSIVLDGAVVEEEAILGAGSLLPEGKTVPRGHLAFGSPAKVIRPLTEDEIRGIRKNADHYIEKSKINRGRNE